MQITDDMAKEERQVCWEMVIEEWSSSGLTKMEYCQKNDIPVSTFNYWYNKISNSNNVCAHCGKRIPPNQQIVDHAIPVILGGGNDPRNLMPLCKKCNKDKASGEIIPSTYYKYASPYALEELQSYIFEWKLAHTRSDGTMTVERFGIME